MNYRVRGLTGWVDGKGRPAVVEEVLFSTGGDTLQDAHLTGGCSEVLQASTDTDQGSDARQGDFSSETLVWSNVEVDIRARWSIKLECFWVGDSIGILARRTLVYRISFDFMKLLRSNIPIGRSPSCQVRSSVHQSRPCPHRDGCFVGCWSSVELRGRTAGETCLMIPSPS